MRDQHILSSENSKRWSLTAKWLEKTPPRTIGDILSKDKSLFEIQRKVGTEFTKYNFDDIDFVKKAWQNEDAMSLNVMASDRTIYGSARNFSEMYMQKLMGSKAIGGKCFPSGTLVSISNAKQIEIEEVQQGDTVLAGLASC